jgi:hypothetical protein
VDVGKIVGIDIEDQGRIRAVEYRPAGGDEADPIDDRRVALLPLPPAQHVGIG